MSFNEWVHMSYIGLTSSGVLLSLYLYIVDAKAEPILFPVMSILFLTITLESAEKLGTE